MATYSGEDHTAQLFIWLRLHGANPDEIPLNEDMTITTDDDGVKRLNWSQFALVNGGRYVGPQGEVAIEKHSTRLVAPPPDWWEPVVHPTREELREQLNAAYRERAHLVAHLATLYPATMGDDPTDPDWRIVYLDTPAGQWSWHISRDDLDLFGHVPEGAVEWDGHTTEQKYQRMRDLTAAIAEQCGAA